MNTKLLLLCCFVAYCFAQVLPTKHLGAVESTKHAPAESTKQAPVMATKAVIQPTKLPIQVTKMPIQLTKEEKETLEPTLGTLEEAQETMEQEEQEHLLPKQKPILYEHEPLVEPTLIEMTGVEPEEDLNVTDEELEHLMGQQILPTQEEIETGGAELPMETEMPTKEEIETGAAEMPTKEEIETGAAEMPTKEEIEMGTEAPLEMPIEQETKMQEEEEEEIPMPTEIETGAAEMPTKEEIEMGTEAPLEEPEHQQQSRQIFRPRPRCGNFRRERGEDCDPPGGCCTRFCKFARRGSPCLCRTRPTRLFGRCTGFSTRCNCGRPF